MRPSRFLGEGLLGIGLLLAGAVAAAPAAQQPESYAVIYRLDAHKLVELEMVRAALETLELPGEMEQSFARVPGRSATVRFPAAQSLRFVVRNRWTQSWSWNELSPTGFRLFPLKSEGDSRILRLRERTAQRSVEHRGLALKVTPRGPESLQLEPARALEAGEYALYYSGGEEPCDLFCFAVDS